MTENVRSFHASTFGSSVVVMIAFDGPPRCSTSTSIRASIVASRAHRCVLAPERVNPLAACLELPLASCQPARNGIAGLHTASKHGHCSRKACRVHLCQFPLDGCFQAAVQVHLP